MFLKLKSQARTARNAMKVFFVVIIMIFVAITTFCLFSWAEFLPEAWGSIDEESTSLSILNTQWFYRHFLQGRWFKGLLECCMLTTPDHVVVHHRSQMIFNPFGTYSLVGVNSFSLMLGSVFTQASRCLAFGMFSVGNPQWTIWSQHGDDKQNFVQNHLSKNQKHLKSSLANCWHVSRFWDEKSTRHCHQNG